MNPPERITVLGFGSWGAAIACHLYQQGYSVTAWHKFPEEIGDIRNSGYHNLLPELKIPPELPLTDDLDTAVSGCTMLVVAVPSHIVRILFSDLKHSLPDPILVVNLAKGIENDSLLTMSQVIEEVAGVPAESVVTLYGPSHAEEVSQGMPTTIVASSTSLEQATRVQRVFSSPRLRVYTNPDILGAELGGSLKNVIAIAAGICDGIGFGDNTKAALLTRGITEITRLGVTMGAAMETFYGLSGIGDLIATCLSRHSRNRYVGEEIGKGRQLQDILGGMKMVAEGVKSTKSAWQLSRKYQVDMPITQAVYQVLFEGKDPHQAVEELMTRDLTEEKPY
ncbi:MAG: NAD(P)-dependent glycerol-3-phosphate dehydrogenase [Candidatus Neomarinimicrobiota bacterium]|nr:MAG: NAD(P)-dependent glycerol-3-phosphate dehydrogenase [Candidatus Neomarinimicrobiota bacterium]